MTRHLLNSNVDIAATLLNGFVGETPIFVNPVIRDNVVETMSANIPKINYLNVKGKITVL